MFKLVSQRPLDAKLEYLHSVVDSNAWAAVQRLRPDQLEEAFGLFDVSNVRNMSAFVWSKIKAFSVPGGGDHLHMAPQRQAPRPSRTDLPHPPPGPKPNRDNGAPETPKATTEKARRCQAELAKLPEKEQADILDSIDEGMRNPSAYVWSTTTQDYELAQ